MTACKVLSLRMAARRIDAERLQGARESGPLTREQSWEQRLSSRHYPASVEERGYEMKAMEVKQHIAFKNILFATDLDISARRALPFAVALADHCGAKLYAAHVIPHAAYAFAHPESVERMLKEAQDYANYELNQIIDPLRLRGQTCEALLGHGDVADVLTEFVHNHAADLVVVGTSSRAGVGKVLLGSIAEEIIRGAPCPVLTVGPQVMAEAAGIQSIVCATDFSPGSLRAAEVAVSLAHEYQAHLTLVHVVEGVLRDSPHLAIQLTEKRLREMIPLVPELLHEPQVMVEIGPVAKRILAVEAELLADTIVMGVRGAGAFAQTASHFGSIAHTVVSLSTCPVLTVGDVEKTENE
jgi:nucleotide-binding universal stress UspA family protein